MVQIMLTLKDTIVCVYLTYAHAHATCYQQYMDDLSNKWGAYKLQSSSDVAHIHRIDYIPWKTNFLMGFILLIGYGSLLCIEFLSISIKIPPGLLEEPPDCNKFTQVKALWYEGFAVANRPSAKVRYPER